MVMIRNNKKPNGRDVSGAQKASHWVGSRADENERTAKFRDKKFEGYSELKPGFDGTRNARGRGEVDDKTLKQLEDEYILNLQKQIALMEQELKLLKERELEQNKSAAGYEVLLKDGIPVNEHFIALKNKYNVEKETWEKKLNNQDEDNKSELKNNREKQNKIEILNYEFEVISDRHNYFKAETTDKIFNETNTIDKLTAEKDALSSEFIELETENAQLERLIARNKMFNKKADLVRKRNEEIEKWEKKVREMTEEIEKKDFELYSQNMKLEDKDLIKKENER